MTVVIPSERSESRARQLVFLTESTESTEPGAAISPPDHSKHLELWMEGSDAPVRLPRPGKQFSVLSVRHPRAEYQLGVW